MVVKIKVIEQVLNTFRFGIENRAVVLRVTSVVVVVVVVT